jgi:hypothetical protein
MSWPIRTPHTRAGRPTRHWHGIGAVLLMAIVLLIAACGPTTGGSVLPTPTPKSTATATPAPCASWRIVSSPNMPGLPHSALRSVTALSPTQAWAVGVTYAVGDTVGPVNSLIEQWDGSAWQIVASAGYDALAGVAAISSSDVWAVGGQLNYGVVGGIVQPERPLIMHWDGTAWSVVPSVRPADANAVELSSVTSITSRDVWAVGRQDTGSAHLLQPLVEHWDGAAWHLVSSPLPQGATNGMLTAVTRIPGTNQLWAGGESSKYAVPTLPEPLIERWDGTAWQIVTGPALPNGALGGTWNGLVALSATDAWAVGTYYVRNPVDLHPLIGHWDGTRWTTVANPEASGELNSVAAAGAHDVRAAGSMLTGSDAHGRRVPLLERWNGTAWQTMTAPEPPGALSVPLGIATDGAGNYWAVGSYLTAASVYQTLTLRCP